MLAFLWRGITLIVTGRKNREDRILSIVRVRYKICGLSINACSWSIFERHGQTRKVKYLKYIIQTFVYAKIRASVGTTRGQKSPVVVATLVNMLLLHTHVHVNVVRTFLKATLSL